MIDDGRKEEEYLLEKKTKSDGFIEKVLNAPILASMLSIAICFIGPLRKVLTAENSLFNRSFMSIGGQVSDAYIFCVLILLGLELTSFDLGDREEVQSIMSTNKLVWSSVLKLIVCPLAFTFVFLFYGRIGLLDDDVMIFIYLTMLALPNAINMIVITAEKKAFVS